MAIGGQALRYNHEDVSPIAGDAWRLVTQRQDCRDWPIPAEPVAEEFRCEQDLGEGASEGEAGHYSFRKPFASVMILC